MANFSQVQILLRENNTSPFQNGIVELVGQLTSDFQAAQYQAGATKIQIVLPPGTTMCQICSYASRNSSQLIVHLRTHTGDTPFHCLQCSAKFKINSDLKRHIRTHTGEKPFQCDLCEYKSTNKGKCKTKGN
uniref:C2H2-type domain-containing protein n=1 Tax=Biomphalaria glabrata TaxID=6526 RepID=A0A2C9MAE5_BIOGL